MPVDQSLAAESVLDTDEDLRPISMSRDGTMLSFDSGQDPNRDVGIVRLDGSREYELVVASEADEARADISPDGRFVAYMSNRNGQMEVYVAELGGVGGLSVVRTVNVSTSERGGSSPRWSRDGTQIYYKSVVGSRFLAVHFDADAFEASEPRQVADVVTGSGTNFAVAADGRLLVTRLPPSQRATGFVIVTNWFEELRELVPPGGR